MIDQTISHYHIIEKLGAVGIGVVYKAEDTKLERTVAIKFLPSELAIDDEAKNRFNQEAKAASSLEHNNICNVHEINQIDQLSKEIASGVGLSKKKNESIPAQIIEVTTSSMDAYNIFLRVRDEYERLNHTEASRYLERAVSSETNYAITYLYLARTYSDLVEPVKTKQAIVKAKALSYKAPEKVRLEIESSYSSIIERNTLKQFNLLNYTNEKRFHNALGIYFKSWSRIKEAQAEYEKAIELDPNFASPTNGLAYVYAAQGIYDKAITTLQRYAALSTGDANPFDSMCQIYLQMGNLGKSIAKYRKAISFQLSFFLSYNSLSYVYALDENYPECINLIDSSIIIGSTKGMKSNSLAWKSIYFFLTSRIKESISQIVQMGNYAKKMSDDLFIVPLYWVRVWNKLNRGDKKSACEDFESFYKLYSDRNIQSPVLNKTFRAYHLANVFLSQVQIDSASLKCSEIKSNLSILKTLQSVLIMQTGIPEAEILIAKGQPVDAIRVYRNIPVDKISRGVGWFMPMYSVPYIRDVVPCAFIKKGELDSSITEYEKLLRIYPNNMDRRLSNPIYHYRLAMLCEQTGKYDKVKTEYTRFLELWKHADRDQPALVDAKKRLAKLTLKRKV